ARRDAARGPGAVSATDLGAGARAIAHADRTGAAQIDERLVDRSVAVVVEPIARLDDGRVRLGAVDRPALAMVHARAADAGIARVASPAAPRIAVVARAVAVIVEAVAGLRDRRCIRHAHDRAALAVVDTGRADAGLAGAAARAAAGIVLVGLPVAVVVQRVAGLGLRQDVLDAGEAPVLALLRARTAHPEEMRVAGGAAGPLVDLPVAVVVVAVADLVAR